MHRIFCSTGALLGMPNGRNWRLLADCRDKLSCDGYEFMFYDTWYAEAGEIMAFLEKIALPVAVWHCEKRVGELLSLDQTAAAVEQFTLNCRMAARLGAGIMVLHLWNGQVSDSFISRNIAAYPALQEIAEKYHIDLTVENVVCNHQNPLTHWRALAEKYPCIGLTMDTKMAAFHEQLDQLYAPENRAFWNKNIRHIHVNDYGGGYMDWQNLRTLHPGQGKIDFDKFFSFLSRTQYRGDFTVEATAFLPDGVIHWEDLNRTFAWLRDKAAGLSLESEHAISHGTCIAPLG